MLRCWAAASAGLCRRQGPSAGARRSFTGGPVGQPIPATHPHLLLPGQLTPGIAAAEYAARRSALSASIPPGSLAILPAAPQVYVTGKIPYPYRQDADFLYLTGLDQEVTGAVMMLMTPKASDQSADPIFALSIPNNEVERVRWDGVRVGHEAAKEVFGAEEVFPLHSLARDMGAAIDQAQVVLFDGDRLGGHLQRQIPALGKAITEGRIQPLRPHIHALRWKKSAAEQELMRQAAAVSADAIVRSMGVSHGGVGEHTLSATFEGHCREKGAKRMAYPQVVGGGERGCIIHYGRNDDVVHDGQMVLMDAGCELHGYASDITRSWPVNGKYTSAQKDVYQAVLETHLKCIAMCSQGYTLRQLHHLSVELLSQALVDLGVVGGSGSGVARSSYRPFYPHSVGHWLGLDTHDSATVALDKALEPGVVLTLEPGLYLPDNEHVPAHLRGIGVRIEDDILIGPGGEAIVISDGVPKGVTEVEELVGTMRE